MSGWSIGDVLEAVASARPAALAQIQGAREVSWRDFDRRSNGIVQTLLDGGAGHQDKVAQYLYNCPEYLESVAACFKGSFVPVNTNYRYVDRELLYLWDNADVVAIVFHGCFAERIETLRSRLPGSRETMEVAGTPVEFMHPGDLDDAVRDVLTDSSAP